MLYVDNAATSPMLPQALEAAWPWLTSEFGNPSSAHELGLRASAALQDARKRVAAWLGCRESEITFTSGATESNNLAIAGIALANPRGRHIISAKTEHESVLQTLDFLERVHGFEIEWLDLDRTGKVQGLEKALRSDTTLVTLMTVNNEIGTIHPIAELAAIAKVHGVPFHTDAVQAAGWLDIRVNQSGVSALSLSGHKLGAPKGVGVLYCSNRLVLEPLIHGGGQEFERRSGTENVAWAVAFATAVEALPTSVDSALIQDFIDEVLKQIPNAQLTGDRNRQAGIASFVFEGVNGETLLLELENQGVICSSGSACAAGSTEPSHVLTALGYEADLAQTAVRFSFSRDINAQDTEQVLSALKVAHAKISA